MQIFRRLLTIGLFLFAPVAAHALEVRSDIPAFLAKETNEVGYNPTWTPEENTCFPASDDFSNSGKIIAAHDWIITSELATQGLEFVAFAGRAEETGNGGCDYGDGFISVYRDGDFIALIENANTDEQLLATIRIAADGTVEISASNGAGPVGRIIYDQDRDLLLVTAP